MIDKTNKLSIRKQSKLLSLNRSSLYITPTQKNDNILCNMIIEIYSAYPIYGYRRITAMLQRQAIVVNHKKVLRLMRELNIQAIYPKPNTSKKNEVNSTYPYLLQNMTITKVNQVWQVDITYLKTSSGFLYLVAIIDVYSRLIMGWKISNSLCADSCINALEDALIRHGKPKIMNSDQGSQFTGEDWIKFLQEYNIMVSMTGRGRCSDNIYIERLWRSFKYEGSYLYKWNSVAELKMNIPKWIGWYNQERPHQALDYQTPMEKYYGFMDNSNELPTIPQYQLQNESIFKFNFVAF